jgi:hypothetical protein
MKKLTIVFILIFSVSVYKVTACEICGCGVGNFYMGLLPNFEDKFIGVRYQYMKYHTAMKENPEEFSKDTYQTMELWGGWNLGKRWRLMAFVPYQVSKQITDDGNKSNNGLGDIIMLGNYSLLHKFNMKANKKITEHEWWIGGGIKLPTGHYDIDLESADANIGDVNAQMGTGSTDFLVNTSYNVRFNKWGINTTLNYKINTTNSNGYYFGNRFMANSLAYYNIKAGGTTFAPNAGLLFEDAASNYLNDEKVELTGGQALFSMAGVEMSFKKIAAGINAQLPLAQNFAEHHTESSIRGLAHKTLAY